VYGPLVRRIVSADVKIFSVLLDKTAANKGIIAAGFDNRKYS